MIGAKMPKEFMSNEIYARHKGQPILRSETIAIASFDDRDTVMFIRKSVARETQLFRNMIEREEASPVVRIGKQSRRDVLVLQMKYSPKALKNLFNFLEHKQINPYGLSMNNILEMIRLAVEVKYDKDDENSFLLQVLQEFNLRHMSSENLTILNNLNLSLKNSDVEEFVTVHKIRLMLKHVKQCFDSLSHLVENKV